MVTIVAYVMVRWDVTISDRQSPEGRIQEEELRGSSLFKGWRSGENKRGYCLPAPLWGSRAQRAFVGKEERNRAEVVGRVGSHCLIVYLLLVL